MTPVSSSLPTTSVKVETPDGTLFVHIAEENGRAREVLLNIGKSGYSLAAWSDALARMVSLALKHGIAMQDIVVELSNIHTDRVRRSNGVAIHSGPDGLAVALMRYLATKAKRGTDDDYRPATLES